MVRSIDWKNIFSYLFSQSSKRKLDQWEEGEQGTVYIVVYVIK